MDCFFSWFGTSSRQVDGLLRAGLAHLYFVTIHPFEDGNGRIARAINDMALAQDEKLANRFYSLSGQIMNERDDYYAVLEKTQKGNGDVTQWLSWYLSCFQRAHAASYRDSTSCTSYRSPTDMDHFYRACP